MPPGFHRVRRMGGGKRLRSTTRKQTGALVLGYAIETAKCLPGVQVVCVEIWHQRNRKSLTIHPLPLCATPGSASTSDCVPSPSTPPVCLSPRKRWRLSPVFIPFFTFIKVLSVVTRHLGNSPRPQTRRVARHRGGVDNPCGQRSGVDPAGLLGRTHALETAESPLWGGGCRLAGFVLEHSEQRHGVWVAFKPDLVGGKRSHAGFGDLASGGGAGLSA